MPIRRLLFVALSLLVLSGCDPHTIEIRFEPAVGDAYRFRSDVRTEVARTIEGETTTEDASSVLDATERVIAVDDDEVRIEVTLERDGTTQRTYDVRFDRGDRLTAIDLVEGVPADALGLDLATDLPADVASPPPGPLEPGTAWVIERVVEIAGEADPIVVRGTGRIDALGVVDGNDVAVVVVDLEVPIRSTIETADGEVTVRGEQTSRSRTTYDLTDGAARSDRTDITGEVAVIVAPPDGIDAAPVEGAIAYRIETRTRRVPQAKA
ncbi:MAG: hypothetical protein OSA99_08640 [Acidimicrobiales bacterium]|nr:hypothetical protein [Acidimicrobiales bacterium]